MVSNRSPEGKQPHNDDQITITISSIMEFIRSQRGAAKLCFEGFSYTKKKETKSTFRWECSQRRSDNCKGTVTSDNPVS
ncbi:hypothetical protein DPMN_017226 [Dreissena polymorpha]|uniref:FLYWCH-type domain-containing protein n=1 Tax=Dreissena polymorpha TaxID=45954 RepID=A0A9D4NCS0_DREPO|nr:hypothetical protein DPMN_017217 [Dreissena polymorpha]KAH3893083.1 hypothetical protein DPMN_017226 [Dreissena polymorpha]